MGKLFGTDGIRGVANQYPMTPEMAVTIGKAVATFFKGKHKQSKIVIGKDTRISGDMLEHALISGICSMGVNAYLAGILPTPGVAFMTLSTGANAGIVISASHNPYYDNGIKIFKNNGYKLSDEEEDEIEQLVLNKSMAPSPKSMRDTGRVYEIEDAAITYGNFLKRTVSEKYYFKDLKMVIDCSNGATFEVAPAIFTELGAKVKTLYNNPDGKNINDNCGSQHPENLKKSVIKNGADIGFAFDGDGDRLIAVDENGTVSTGDQILAVCAKFMKQKELLEGNRVVSTLDIYPTIMELCGLEMPYETAGRSFGRLLQNSSGEETAWEDLAYVYYKQGITLRTERFRLTKYFREEEPALELYDHRHDPLETRNVASDNPGIVERLMPIWERGNTGLYGK